ncbi:MAG: methytransferase partner Trm112 [Methanomicrobiales archaeon]|nr:methytransferase partner Trm112 [Methanomicrobiales archaeon]
MRRKLLDILCCPVCKGELTLNVVEENDVEIVEGSLRCGTCRVEYPIIDGIPNLLPPEAEDS